MYAEPEQLVLNVSKHDKFIVIASDGVFEFITSHKVFPRGLSNDVIRMAKGWDAHALAILFEVPFVGPRNTLTTDHVARKCFFVSTVTNKYRLSLCQVMEAVERFTDPLSAAKHIVQEAFRTWLRYEVRTDDITIIVMSIENFDEAHDAQVRPNRELCPALFAALMCRKHMKDWGWAGGKNNDFLRRSH